MAFKKGQSGNPGGRPKESPELKELARTFTSEAVKRLAHWMRSDDAAASVKASSTLLERGWGKPETKIDGEIRHSYIIEVPAIIEDAEEWSQKSKLH